MEHDLRTHGRLTMNGEGLALRVAVAATLLACAAAAGAMPAASGAAPRVQAAAAAGDEAGRAGQQAGPIVLVLPSGEAHLVLRAAPEQVDGDVAWHVVYLAGDDPGELARPEAQARLGAVARELVDAFRPLAEMAQVGRFSVTALLGKPGESGAIERRGFARDAGRWRPDGTARRYRVEQVPALPEVAVRSPAEEARIREAAAEFAAALRRADYDVAWTRASAVVKAAMSQAEFEVRLAAMPALGARPGTTPYLAFPPDPFVPGTFVETWSSRETASGVEVQALSLRLDDDGEWRVAGVVQAVAEPSSEDMPAALKTASDL